MSRQVEDLFIYLFNYYLCTFQSLTTTSKVTNIIIVFTLRSVIFTTFVSLLPFYDKT